jgi:predicted DNA-binding transcriptional regulator AlpA
MPCAETNKYIPLNEKKKRGVNKEPPPCDLEGSYYTSRQLSRALSLSMSTLAEYRRKGIGPKFVAFGYRSYRYPKEEVRRYIDEMTRASTSATQNYDLPH